MKSFLTLIIALLVSNFNFASNGNSNEDYAKAAKVVAKYLESIVFEESINRDASIKIALTVNEENEIIVLTVDTHSNSIRRTIKSTLNKKKLSAGDLIPGKEYSFVLDVKAN